jgi:SAM-dependent methyltransferase
MTLTSSIKKIVSRFSEPARAAKPSQFVDDDFDWRTYHDHYQGELASIQETHTLQLTEGGDYTFDGGGLTRRTSIAPLHPNHRLLYETILQLAPTSVLEVGCGGGDHLRNFQLLSPRITYHGVDRSEEQLNLLKKRNPGLRAEIGQRDITLPFSELWSRVDTCYTQAVIMHIKTGNGHLVALANLFKLATKHVVLMENWRHHEFLDDVRFLHRNRMIPWEHLYSYVRRSPELDNRPHLLVFSSSPLDYEPLHDYEALLSGVETR